MPLHAFFFNMKNKRFLNKQGLINFAMLKAQAVLLYMKTDWNYVKWVQAHDFKMPLEFIQQLLKEATM